ncbi:MAG: hypothetical protein U0S48_10400 [Solirubrobacteraceae bacterium]
MLEPAELITGVELAPPAPARAVALPQGARAASFAFALVSVAAVLEVADDGTIRDCAVALGGVAHAPWRARAAEEALRGDPGGGGLRPGGGRRLRSHAAACATTPTRSAWPTSVIVRTLAELTAG